MSIIIEKAKQASLLVIALALAIPGITSAQETITPDVCLCADTLLLDGQMVCLGPICTSPAADAPSLELGGAELDAGAPSLFQIDAAAAGTGSRTFKCGTSRYTLNTGSGRGDCSSSRDASGAQTFRCDDGVNHAEMRCENIPMFFDISNSWNNDVGGSGTITPG